MLVSYTGENEVIICEVEKEESTVKEYFTNGGRNTEDYDRELHINVVQITAEIKIWDYE